MRVELHTNDHAFLQLEEEWDALLERSHQPSLFLTHAWVSTWWRVFGPGHALHLLTVRDDAGCMLGIAPCQVRTGAEGFPPGTRVLMLLGQQGDTLAEELDCIAATGEEARVADAIARHLIASQPGTWDVIHFERVRSDAVAMPLLEAALSRAGLATQRQAEQPSPYLTLPDAAESLLASCSKNFRSQLRSGRNRLAREGDVEVQIAGRDIDVGDAFDTLVALHRARWGPDDGSFDTEAYVAFHRALCPRLLEAGRLLLVLLCVDGRAVAARYDFLFAERIWCFQGGWDPAYEKQRVGTILTAEVMRLGIEQGATEYAFLSGDDAYKRRWTSESRTLHDLVVWGRGRRATWARLRQQLKATLRRVPGMRALARLRR
jgi:CelD/BcsL family acetyltransferase involved in cellulose biosynthesis